MRAASLRNALILGVEAYAGGTTGIRDDIALLVGVVTPAATGGEPQRDSSYVTVV